MIKNKQLFLLIILLFSNKLSGFHVISMDFAESVLALCPLTKTSFLAGTKSGLINIFNTERNDIFRPKINSGSYWPIYLPEHQLNLGPKAISCLSLLGDGSTFASGGVDTIVRFWKNTDSEYLCFQTIKELEHPIRSLFCNKDNDLVFLTMKGEIKIWSSNSGFPTIKDLESPIGQITSMAKINQNFFVAGGLNGKIITCLIEKELGLKPLGIYNIKPALPIQALINVKNDIIVAYKDHITVLSIMPEEGSLVCQTKQIILTNNPHPILAPLHDGTFASVEVSPESTDVNFGIHSYDIKIWEKIQNNYQCIKTLSCHKSQIYSIIQLDNGNIVSGSKNGEIIIWNGDDHRTV